MLGPGKIIQWKSRKYRKVPAPLRLGKTNHAAPLWLVSTGNGCLGSCVAALFPASAAIGARECSGRGSEAGIRWSRRGYGREKKSRGSKNCFKNDFKSMQNIHEKASRTIPNLELIKNRDIIDAKYFQKWLALHRFPGNN
jgi:hypothetical protein